jgi:putative sporulation protein YyaC
MVISSIRLAKDTFSCHFEDPLCLQLLENSVYRLMSAMNNNYQRETVFLCVGTDRATGDCLGPLVGTRMLALSSSINLFGTLESPSHAVNLQTVMNKISARFVNPLVIAVDASLGSPDRIGFIDLKPVGLKPGTALNKELPMVGDFHISAVVNVGGYLEQMVLQNTRLYGVYMMAELIARSLYQAHLHHEADRQLRLVPAGAN